MISFCKSAFASPAMALSAKSPALLSPSAKTPIIILISCGVSLSLAMFLAMDTAKNRARDEISRVIGVKVSNMIKDFLEEAGVSGESVATEFTSSVSKSVSSNFLSGSKLEQQDLYEIDTDEDGNPNAYEAFALMKVSLKDMSSKIDEVMKNNAAAYAKLQANKAFDDLAKELKEINGTDESLKPVVPTTEE